jgi:hypothetical protein
MGIEPGSLTTGSKRTVYECSEIAGSPHVVILKKIVVNTGERRESGTVFIYSILLHMKFSILTTI